jgi:hypothetical protein
MNKKGTVSIVLSLLLLFMVMSTVDASPVCSSKCHVTNAAYLNSDWFSSIQTSGSIKKYVGELSTYQIKYQFADIGVLNDNGSLDPQEYQGLAQWIKYSKLTNRNQLVIIDLNYGHRFDRIGGVKVPNPSFGNPTFNKNLNAIIDKLVNKGVQIGGKGPFYKADGVHLDIEGFMKNDQTLLSTLKFVRANSLKNNTNFSISSPIDPTYDGAASYQWDNRFIHQVGAVVNTINPMMYDSMGWGSDVVDAASYQELWTSEIERYSNATKNMRVKILPTMPSYEKKIADDGTVYHDPAIENIENSIIGLKQAISNGAKVEGAGIFWWSSFIAPNHQKDHSDWLRSWVHAS